MDEFGVGIVCRASRVNCGLETGEVTPLDGAKPLRQPSAEEWHCGGHGDHVCDDDECIDLPDSLGRKAGAPAFPCRFRGFGFVVTHGLMDSKFRTF